VGAEAQKEHEPNRTLVVGWWNFDTEERKALVSAYGHNYCAR